MLIERFRFELRKKNEISVGRCGTDAGWGEMVKVGERTRVWQARAIFFLEEAHNRGGARNLPRRRTLPFAEPSSFELLFATA